MNTQTRRAKFSNFGLAPIFLAIAFALAVPATHAAPPATGDWSLVWSDEFDCGSTKEAPNPANWGFEYGYVRNSEDQKYTDSLKNAYCQNGLMNIEAHKEQDGTITSASLLSSGKVSHKYGWIEMRGRIDTRLGSWPAFWSLGTEGQWPDSGESDIMEFYTGKLLFNAAWWKTGDGTWDARWDSVAVNVSSLPSGWKDEFHVWAMEWTPDYVKYYMDGVLYNTWDSSQDNNGGGDTSTEGFQHPHYLLLNQAIGGTAGGDASGLAYPTTYEIDYVRWYQNQNPETMIDDSDASITYSGTWGTYVGNGGHMNTEHYSETTGSTATFSFNGTQARYYGFKRNDLGRVNIYVDDVHITTLDLYSSTFLTNQLLFETDVLSSGSHTLKVELTGTQNSSSSGYEAIIDAFSWTDSGDTPPPAQNEIMTWVPPYGDEESRLMAAADFGTCSPKDGLTRVGLQFWEVNSDGTIDYEQRSYLDLNDDDVAWWTAWGQANDIDILLTVHNHDGNSWNWALARSAFVDNRTTLVNSLVTEMERLGLDGVDMDFEGCDGILGTDRADFAQFIQELSGELKARGKILTVDSFRYIWCAPNVNWRPDWLGYIDNIHVMGYEDLYEGSTVNSNGNYYNKYSYHQNKAVDAGYAGNDALMGFPGNFSEWGTSTGYGTDASAHLQEVLNLSHGPTGIAIWDLQLPAADWQTSDLWCEIVALKTAVGGGGGGGDTTAPTPNPMTWAQTPYMNQTWPDDNVATMTATTASDPSGGIEYYFECIEAANGCEDSGWQASSIFSDWYLISDNTFHYRVKTRDAYGNETGWSAEATITVGSGGGTDTTTWVLTPYLNPNWLPDSNVASMTATSSLSGTVEYYFDCIEAPDGGYWNGCEDSGWLSTGSFNDWFMEEGNLYHYRVKSRNSVDNETGWSVEAAFSFGTVNTPPTPNFSFNTSDLTVNFIDGSSDSDGTISNWLWNFGDGGTSTTQSPSHTYVTANTYTVSLTVTDNDGATNNIIKSVMVTEPPVPDTEAPSIIAPVNVTVEAIGVTTTVTLGSAIVSDNIDPSPVVTNNAPAGFPVGTTTVTWTATDDSDNSASSTQTVTVTDTTAPTITAPADISVESSESIAVALGAPTVSDLVDSNPTVTNNAPDLFPVGETTTVTWTATDNLGNSATATQTVTVTAPPPPDTEAPSITAPANITAEATGVTTTVTLGSATATDNVDPTPTVTNDAPAAFSVGTTIVTWTATDDSGNSASATQTVTVTDTTAPTITAPADISVESSEPIAVALGAPMVSDMVDPNPTVTNNAPALFLLGTTIVTWTATDTLGNSATATQTVIVTAPPPLVEIHVGDLDATASGNKRWTATVTVTVHDSSNAAVAGVTVSGTWSDGSSGSCIADNIGQCSTARITKELSLTFTVNSLSNGDDIYDDGANNVTSITINQDGSTSTPGVDTTPPTITLLGDNPISIEVGSTYDDAGASANDDVDGDLTANIQTDSTVNTDVVGTYTVTYNVSDNAGNAADQVVRTVTVTDPGALAAPTDLSAKLSRRTETVALKWNDSNSGEDGFIIERSKDGSVIGTVTVNDATSYIDDLSGDTGTFSYRVKAYKGTDESDYSDSASILKK